MHGTNLCEKVYGEVLVLAGDIGNAFQKSYSDFLKDVSEKYAHVIVVAGNHGMCSRSLASILRDHDENNMFHSISFHNHDEFISVFKNFTTMNIGVVMNK